MSSLAPNPILLANVDDGEKDNDDDGVRGVDNNELEGGEGWACEGVGDSKERRPDDIEDERL